jgi:hypothetical protein
VDMHLWDSHIDLSSKYGRSWCLSTRPYQQRILINKTSVVKYTIVNRSHRSRHMGEGSVVNKTYEPVCMHEVGPSTAYVFY